MAIRPVYIVTPDLGVIQQDVDFKWFAGQSIGQVQKSIRSQHEEILANQLVNSDELIEISSKSENPLGIALSAFNLKTKTETHNREYTVESAFQSSKVFENGGPFKDILTQDSKSAKGDSRLKESGKLKYFLFFGNKFELEPLTAFYDWLYINVLLKNPDLCKDILKYRAFTDMAFNPKKSINTQAHSVALYVALVLSNVDMTDMKEPEIFLEKTKRFYPII